MSKSKFIYILPEYSNSNNLINIRTQTDDEYRLSFTKNNLIINLSEINSLIENEYCLILHSSKIILESNKESMIHSHNKGHKDKHLQFKLYSKKEVIRIFLDNLDDEDYHKCIKGFLFIAHELIKIEQKENFIEENLIKYFFNENIDKLFYDKMFLITKINESYLNNQIKDFQNKIISCDKLKEFQKEPHLSLFLREIKP